MAQTLIISGHPDLQQSYAHRMILQVLESSALDLCVKRLDQLYPDYQIDVEAEQSALLAADRVVLHFPSSWFAMPALLKKWLDDVFVEGFAYGDQGGKMQGKALLLSITMAQRDCPKGPLARKGAFLKPLLYPLQQVAKRSGMVFPPPVLSDGMLSSSDTCSTQHKLEQHANQHGQKLLGLIKEQGRATVQATAQDASTRVMPGVSCRTMWTLF
ncbi:NAD(P)H-dependent oxidoreductase [Magnetococcus sp. PR-3]|uniref:NAD(P)H-dependent oxidoreductase n=1 Tax=Magnetococcus sp. PR-3 TaxID=3120355 RepID=UPI002FCE5D8A